MNFWQITRWWATKRRYPPYQIPENWCFGTYLIAFKVFKHSFDEIIEKIARLETQINQIA